MYVWSVKSLETHVEIKVWLFQLGVLVSNYVRMKGKVARDSRRNQSLVISDFFSSKDLWSEVIKSTCFLVRYFLLNYFKDLWYNSRKIQQMFFVVNNESIFSQHSLAKENNKRWFTSSFHKFSYIVHLLLFSLANGCWLNVDSLLATKNICWIFHPKGEIF